MSLWELPTVAATASNSPHPTMQPFDPKRNAHNKVLRHKLKDNGSNNDKDAHRGPRPLTSAWEHSRNQLIQRRPRVQRTCTQKQAFSRFASLTAATPVTHEDESESCAVDDASQPASTTATGGGSFSRIKSKSVRDIARPTPVSVQRTFRRRANSCPVRMKKPALAAIVEEDCEEEEAEKAEQEWKAKEQEEGEKDTLRGGGRIRAYTISSPRERLPHGVPPLQAAPSSPHIHTGEALPSIVTPATGRCKAPSPLRAQYTAIPAISRQSTSPLSASESFSPTAFTAQRRGRKAAQGNHLEAMRVQSPVARKGQLRREGSPSQLPSAAPTALQRPPTSPLRVATGSNERTVSVSPVRASPFSLAQLAQPSEQRHARSISPQRLSPSKARCGGDGDVFNFAQHLSSKLTARGRPRSDVQLVVSHRPLPSVIRNQYGSDGSDSDTPADRASPKSPFFHLRRRSPLFMNKGDDDEGNEEGEADDAGDGHEGCEDNDNMTLKAQPSAWADPHISETQPTAESVSSTESSPRSSVEDCSDADDGGSHNDASFIVPNTSIYPVTGSAKRAPFHMQLDAKALLKARLGGRSCQDSAVASHATSTASSACTSRQPSCDAFLPPSLEAAEAAMTESDIDADSGVTTADGMKSTVV